MLRWIEIRSLLSKFLFCMSFALFIPLSFAFGVQDTITPFSIAFVFSFIAACLFHLSSFKATGEIRRREGILSVVLLWTIAPFFAGIPFYASGALPHPVDAYFEAMSGLTTTGSSVILDVESVSYPLLLFRSLLQWFGGIGIVVLFLMVLPALRVGGKILYETESSGPIKEAISPIAKVAATKITLLYSSLTLLSFILLLATNPNLSLFDAINLSLTTISTGGFTITNNSINAYPSLATRAILVLFMILGSINFSLYFQLFRKHTNELRFFLFSLILGCAAVSIWLPLEMLGVSIFQAISVHTTTGYMIGDSFLWPVSSKTALLLLMFLGGMSGSTAGGIKTSRFYLLFQIIHHRLESLFRPSVIRTLRIANKEIDATGALTLLTFFCLVGFFVAIGTTLLIFDGLNPSDSFYIVASFLNNVGLNPQMTDFSTFSKLLAIAWMLLGRLEYFIVTLVFMPFFWKK